MPRPGSNGVVTDVFGPRVNPVTRVAGFHEGEDTAPQGNVAPVTGEICYAEYNSGWGYIYGIEERANPGVVWFVAHNAHLRGVEVGRQVTEGEYIAPCGSTGNSTGPHAHTERRVGGTVYPGTGRATDPRPYYTNKAAAPLPEEEEPTMTQPTIVLHLSGPNMAYIVQRNFSEEIEPESRIKHLCKVEGMNFDEIPHINDQDREVMATSLAKDLAKFAQLVDATLDDDQADVIARLRIITDQTKYEPLSDIAIARIEKDRAAAVAAANKAVA